MAKTIDPFKLKFKEAIAYFKGKIPLPSQSWDDLAQEAQDFAFTIAGVTKAELLNDIYSLILKALERGDSFEEFEKNFEAAIDRAGWNPANKYWRTALIFNQNLRSAYQAGRYKQQSDPEMLKLRPYWMWRHRDSRVPRKHHLALDDKIFPADSEFWQTCYPPSGYGCRCTVLAISQKEIEREGLTISTATTEFVRIRDKVTGKILGVPAINGKPIAEPGFTTAPGASRKEDRNVILEQAIARMPKQLQNQIQDELGIP
jgi:SPP1 gp7 family putative phage head morphogenesis protein